MNEVTPQHVSEALKQNGLDGPAFEVKPLSEELSAWLEAGNRLDRLIESHQIGDPTCFAPGWR